MSNVSDHKVLFLLLGGVGAAALLQGFWGMPGNLPSPQKEAFRKKEHHMSDTLKGMSLSPQCAVFPLDAVSAYLDGLGEAPEDPILYRRNEVG